MKKFAVKSILFLLAAVLVFGISMSLPSTPRAATSLLFAERQKDSLLKHTPPPRIIFVGGSNLSFGLNGQLIKDS